MKILKNRTLIEHRSSGTHLTLQVTLLCARSNKNKFENNIGNFFSLSTHFLPKFLVLTFLVENAFIKWEKKLNLMRYNIKQLRKR